MADALPALPLPLAADAGKLVGPELAGLALRDLRGDVVQSAVPAALWLRWTPSFAEPHIPDAAQFVV